VFQIRSKTITKSSRRIVGTLGVALMFSACATGHVDASSGVVPGDTLVGNYLAGRQAQMEGDMDAAGVFLSAALAADPENFDLVRRTFLVYLSDGRMDEALALARQIAVQEPLDTFAVFSIVSASFEAGNYEDARNYLLDLDGSGINSYLVPLLLAWSQVGEGNTDIALELLSPLATGQGTGMLHDAHAALINVSSGRLDEAEKLFGTLMESQGSMTIRTTELFGSLYEQKGEFDKALALYYGYVDEHGVSRYMTDAITRAEQRVSSGIATMTALEGAAEGMFDLASSMRQQNSFETALLLGRLGLQLRPDFPSLQLMVGSTLENIGRYGDANDVYATIDPGVPYAWNAQLRIAANLDDMGETDKAIDTLKQMAKDHPNKSDPYIELGDVYRGSEQFEQAVENYNSAFRLIPQLTGRHWSLLYARGIALERSGEWELAEADFLKALEFRPEQPYVLNYLGYTWVEKGMNLGRAGDMIRKAVELRPNDGYIVDSLGWVYYQLGNFTQAVSELERAIELLPDDPIVNDHLGDAYWKVGRTREARFQWRRSLSLQPDGDTAPLIKTKIESGMVESSSGDTSG
jgi:tetratricopeptide (TPR) repeat protein